MYITFKMHTYIITWLITISFLENRYKYPHFSLTWYYMSLKILFKESDRLLKDFSENIKFSVSNLRGPGICEMHAANNTKILSPSSSY